jgi:uncharacterized protein (TIGR02266 family)
VVEVSADVQTATRAASRAQFYVEEAAKVTDSATSETLGSVARSLQRAARETDPRALRSSFSAVMRQLHEVVDRVATVPDPSRSRAKVAQALVLLHPVHMALEKTSSAAPPEAPSAVPPPAPPRPPTAEPVPPEVLDRRRAPRVEIETDIGFMSDTNFFTGFSGDISEGGLFVATYRPLDIGTRITLSFVLPGGHQITADGRVAWVRATDDPDSDVMPGMGVAFETVSDGGQAVIEEFVRLRQPLFYDLDS